MVGQAYSFTDIAVTIGLLLRLTGYLVSSVDRDAMTVTVLAGTPLRLLNARLHGLGLALHNLGDIDRQTVAARWPPAPTAPAAGASCPPWSPLSRWSPPTVPS